MKRYTDSKRTDLVDHMNCPYCKKEIEVEVQGYQINVVIRKIEDTIMPPEFAESRKIAKRLDKAKQSDKVDILNKHIRSKINEDQELTISEVKALAKEIGSEVMYLPVLRS